MENLKSENLPGDVGFAGEVGLEGLEAGFGVEICEGDGHGGLSERVGERRRLIFSRGQNERGVRAADMDLYLYHHKP